jgi:hypothetical protein
MDLIFDISNSGSKINSSNTCTRNLNITLCFAMLFCVSSLLVRIGYNGSVCLCFREFQYWRNVCVGYVCVHVSRRKARSVGIHSYLRSKLPPNTASHLFVHELVLFKRFLFLFSRLFSFTYMFYVLVLCILCIAEMRCYC